MMRRLVQSLSQTEAGDNRWLSQSIEAASGSSSNETGAAPLNIYEALKQNANIANYKPTARTDVVVEPAHGARDEAYILKDAAKQLYLQISPEEYYLWTQMDGTKSVLDLVVGYCMKYKSLAQARVVGLVESLSSYGLLTEPHFNVYENIENRLSRRKFKYYTDKVMSIFLLHQFPIRGIDGILGWFYKHIFWIFYARIALGLMLGVAISGGIIYAMLALSGNYSVLGESDSFAKGATTLAILQILSIVLHEGGHAFTVKHFGREVRRAGLLFYLGILGAFVDTTDILYEGKWKRIAVTAAGPFLNLVLGGATSIAIAARPDDPLAPLWFQFAVAQYFLVLINATPFIKFDGYYILSDLLGIENLQEKALAFLKNGLFYSFSSAWKRGRLFPSLTREEKLFVIFGGLSALWVANLFFLAILLAPVRFINIINKILSGGSLRQLFVPLVFLFSLLLGFTPRVIRAFRNNVERLNKIASKQPAWQGVLALIAVAFVFILVPVYAAQGSERIASLYARLLPTAMGLVATLLSLRQVRRYSGARWQRLTLGLTLTSGLLALVNLIELLPSNTILVFELARYHALSLIPAMIGIVVVARSWILSLQAEQKWAWALIFAGAIFILISAILPRTFTSPHTTDQLGQHLWAFGIFLYTRLVQRGLPQVKVPALPQNILVGNPQQQGRYTLRWLGQQTVKQAASALGQQKLLPLASEFNRNSASKMWRVWMTMEGEVNAKPQPQVEWETLEATWRLALDDLFTRTAAMAGAPLVKSALYEAFADLPRPLQPMGLQLLNSTTWAEGLEALTSADGDRIYLERAFQSSGEYLLAVCNLVYGWRITEQAIANFNRLSAAHRWEIWLRAPGKFDHRGPNSEQNLPTLARRYRAALTGLVNTLRPIMGEVTLQTNLTRAYDSLPWTQREIANNLLLNELQRQHSGAYTEQSEDERIMLLRGVELLAAAPREALSALAQQMKPHHFRAGRFIARQGQPTHEIYFILQGRAQSTLQDEKGITHISADLTEGAVFGLETALKGQVLEATLQALTDVELLTLNAASLLPYREGVSLQKSEIDWKLIRQIALFREIPLEQLDDIMTAFERKTVPAGHILIEQGKSVDALYVVQSGRFTVEMMTENSESPRQIATLGSGEVFGEQSLLSGNRASATVCANADSEVLRLDAHAFYELFQSHQTVVKHLEQTGSRRRLTTREPLTLSTAARS